jgi:7,8-dihydropterin-6-yl-methyl-4-(beta-D-ribofuranosyl)aminobenzene 5'-phosphate synthase
MGNISLREADRLEIQILVDNYTDLLLESTEIVKRAPFSSIDVPLAEHGLSCLLKVVAGSEEHFVMLDAGMTTISLLHNIEFLGVQIDKIEAFILSHGHNDHYGGLISLLHKARKELLIVLHPDAFLERRLNAPTTGPTKPRQLDEVLLNGKGALLSKLSKASTLASNLILVTGEVERTTHFEKGFPFAEAKINGKWVPDSVKDDQGVVVNVKGKGLVVLQGCSHAGIINTIKYAQKVTRIDKIHAVLGGFHLSGPLFEPIIAQTIAEMKKIGPDIVVPMHCTGWKAINRFAAEMPEQFILNAVGSKYVL